MNPDIIPTALAAPASFSVLSLFWQSHIVVKAVMIGLIVASVWCWAIIFDKYFLFARTRRQIDKFENAFWSGQSLEKLYEQVSERDTHGMASVFVAAMREWKRTHEIAPKSLHGLGSRIDRLERRT